MTHEEPDKSAEVRSARNREIFDIVENAKDRLTEIILSWPESEQGETTPWGHDRGTWRRFEKNGKTYVFITEFSSLVDPYLSADHDSVSLQIQDSDKHKALELETTIGTDREFYFASIDYDSWIDVPFMELTFEDGLALHVGPHGVDRTDVKEEDTTFDSRWKLLTKNSPGMIFTNELLDELSAL